MVWSHPLATGEAVWLQESAAELASGTVTGVSPVICALSVSVPKRPSLADCGARPLVFEGAVGAGVTEAGHAVGQAHGGGPGKPAWRRYFRRLPGPQVRERQRGGRRAAENGRGVTLEHEFAVAPERVIKRGVVVGAGVHLEAHGQVGPAQGGEVELELAPDVVGLVIVEQLGAVGVEAEGDAVGVGDVLGAHRRGALQQDARRLRGEAGRQIAGR